MAANGKKAPKAGVYRDVPPAEYHEWQAASNSALKHLMRSPAHMLAYMVQPPEDTQALILGRAIHAAVLEPHRFDTDYGVLPENLDRRTKFGKDAWEALVEQYGEGNVLKSEERNLCGRIRNAVYANPTARALITGEGDVELSMLWRDRDTKVLCKARWDRHSPQIAGGAIVDLKTTKDASPAVFERAIFIYGYHRQAAMYLSGARVRKLPARHFVIIAVEKEPPYGVAVYRITEGTVEAGRDQLTSLLRLYGQCTRSRTYPGYPDEVRDITVPDWAWKAMDHQTEEIGAMV